MQIIYFLFQNDTRHGLFEVTIDGYQSMFPRAFTKLIEFIKEWSEIQNDGKS